MRGWGIPKDCESFATETLQKAITMPLLLLRRILAFCFFPAQKLWLFFWG